MIPDVITVVKNNVVVTQPTGAEVLVAMAVAASADQAVRSEAALLEIQQIVADAPEAASVVSKAAKAANLSDMADPTVSRENLYLLQKMPEDAEAVGDGATDDAGPLAALLEATPVGGEVFLNDRDYLVSSFDNSRGIDLAGAGRIISDFPGGGRVQLNSYADRGKPYIGREYLSRLKSRIKLGTPLRAFIFGDSTVARGASMITGSISGTTLTVTASNGADIRVGTYVLGAGVTQCNVTALGTGTGGNGTYTISVGQTKASGDINVSNGGGFAGPAGEPQNLIQRLLKRAGVRNPMVFRNLGLAGTKVSDMDAVPYIDTVTGLTDLFVIKYGINDAADGFEAFAAALNAKLAAIRAIPQGRVDQLTIILVGPNSTFNPPIAHDQRFYERIRGIYENAARTHKCFYFDVYAEFRDVTWTFGGGLAYMDAQGIHPAEPMQIDIWSAVMNAVLKDGDLALYNNPGRIGLTFANGWASYGSGFQPGYAALSDDGWVDVGGFIKGGTITGGTLLATLPAEAYYPSFSDVFTCKTETGVCGVRVQIDGGIYLQDASASATWTSLSGIRFRANWANP